MVESEGDFTLSQWESVHDVAETLCCGDDKEDTDEHDTIMYEKEDRIHGGMARFLESTLQEKVARDLRWKE